MSLDQMLRLFAVAALACNVALLSLAVVRRRGRGSDARGAGVVGARALVGVAALLALGATLGSLYLSEIAHLEPCRWCWFQRIAMYPLALVLIVGWLRRDRGVHLYGLPMCLAGAAMSTWHYLLQHFPDLEGATSCSITSPCAVRYAWEFGFVSIPYMAGSVFVLVGALLILSRHRS
ncbi:MAG: disulfide bond formation protein B [Acidimicrobiales bacterium]|nr:disulfide bond formation protein B [Acidimicrobiales bacterium]MYG62149.1 disulfide bond formation protein B [Acidimicrobiales bacterium]MYJ47501.1 disulfide bond formation protein B [Acidimicrobiales bacterium]